MSEREFKGKCFGVRLQPRSPRKDLHVEVQILSEDDENWSECDQPFSAYWLRELIEQLEAAERALKGKAFRKSPNGYGYVFKKRR